MKKNSFRKGVYFLQAALLLLAVILFCGCASGKSGTAVSSSSRITGSSSAKNNASEKNNLKDVSEEEPPAPTITETATPDDGYTGADRDGRPGTGASDERQNNRH